LVWSCSFHGKMPNKEQNSTYPKPSCQRTRKYMLRKRIPREKILTLFIQWV
jgi:hypothetical protein